MSDWITNKDAIRTVHLIKGFKFGDQFKCRDPHCDAQGEQHFFHSYNDEGEVFIARTADAHDEGEVFIARTADATSPWGLIRLSAIAGWKPK